MLPHTTSDEGWTRLEGDAARPVLSLIAAALRPLPLSLAEDRTRLRRKSLSFYPGCDFYAVTSFNTTPPTTRYAVAKGGIVKLIDWTLDSIGQINQIAPLKLTRETITDYVRFVLEFLKGPSGRFILIESAAELELPRDMPADRLAEIKGKIHGLTAQPVPGGGFRLRGIVMFEDVLLATDMEVAANGTLTMTDGSENVIATGLPPVFDPLTMR